ncbi:MAG: VCBS repeat-containing protein, partial [Myxococcota bacterium]
VNSTASGLFINQMLNNSADRTLAGPPAIDWPGNFSGYLPPVSGDFDGDGHADIVSSPPGRDGTYVGFGPDFDPVEAPALGFADGPQSLLVGDVDGDGTSDLITYRTDGESSEVQVSFGRDGEGPVLDPAPDQAHPADVASWEAYELLTGDFDGDGQTDLVWNARGVDNQSFVALAQPLF